MTIRGFEMSGKRYKFVIILLLSLFPILSYSDLTVRSEDKIEAIGALGSIEPRSRVIKVSHNAGAEGVNIQSLLVQEGSQVNKDDVLAVLADHDKKQADAEAVKANIVALNARLASERINLNFAEKEYRRYQSLATNSLASQSVIDSKFLAFRQSQAKIKELIAEIEVAKANLKISEQEIKNTEIRAPITGTVLRIIAWPGERLGDTGLLEIADLSELDVVAEVYETDFPNVKIGQNVEVIIPGVARTYNANVRQLGYQVRKNDLNSTDPLADRDNRIIEVRLTLDEQAISDLQHQIYRQVHVRIKM